MNRTNNRRKELQEQYKEIKTEAGIYQIRNTRNGKIFLNTTRNLRSLNGVQMQLNMKTHMNKELQQDLQEFGSEVFDLTVLEVLKESDNPFIDEKDELKKLEDKWLEQLQPYGEKGYHKKKDGE
ncbi:GIY-YIG nuclease family protein [Paenibacillus gansuensis]|uniref:GIY-YIG nuclease family protein n=1 Tax=Paenibacillus gansuensis TaxID=306542 RepID=A0ABW5PGH7_9BACL